MKSRGFSLVELIIVVVIAGILLALALPSFSSMLRNAKIRNLAGSIVNGLNVAKAEAVQRNKLVSFNLPVDGSGWVVREFAPASAPSEPEKGEGDGSDGPDDAESENPSIQTQGSENVDNLKVVTQGSNVVTFNSLGRLAAGSAASVFDVESTLVGVPCATQANPNGARCLRIEVSAGGLVRMCDPALATGNTQACANPRTGE